MEAVVPVKWLKKHIDEVIVLDASPISTVTAVQSDYKGMIIPNARRFDLKNDFSDQESEIPNTIPSAIQFQRACRKLGINSDSKIVVYDNMGVYTSPRVWWLFRTMGHDQVCVLDGGLPEWIKDGNAVVDAYLSDFDLGDFEARCDDNAIKSYAEIRENIGSRNCLLIDARSSGRFDGSDPEPRKQLKSGSIENSINLPFGEVLNNGKYKPTDDLKKLFRNLNISDRDLIFSCGSGMTACIILLASHLVNDNKTFLYDGSWTEWATKERLLIE